MTNLVANKVETEKIETPKKEVEVKKEKVKPLPVQVQKPKSTKPEITDESILKALKVAGDKAQITPLYDAFDKVGFEKLESSVLKTKLRAKSLKMVEAGKIKATRIKRSFEFSLKSSK